MEYVIDGYNVLFAMYGEYADRENLVDFFVERSQSLSLDFTLVFDATHRIGPWHHTHKGGISVIYTDHSETADSYILEHVEVSKSRKQMTVVTSDKSLAKAVQWLGAKTQSAQQFMTWLGKKGKRLSAPKTLEAFHEPEMDRYVEEFEKRLKNPDTGFQRDLEKWLREFDDNF